MSAREWTPGDVIAWRVDDESYSSPDAIAALMDELIAWWPERPKYVVGVTAGTSALKLVKRIMTEGRHGPLVVIDPEDRKQVERLRDAMDLEVITQNGDPRPQDVTPAQRGNALQFALRSLIAPPRPEEPTGLGAVVEDSEGRQWVRVIPRIGYFFWQSADADHRSAKWAGIDVVKVLSEGWSE